MSEAVHGCFDNHAEVITATIESIRGVKIKVPITNLNY
jgi:hypothetical protein